MEINRLQSEDLTEANGWLYGATNSYAEGRHMSPGNYSHYPVISHTGKEYEKKKMGICIRTTKLFCFTAEIDITL